MWRTLPWRKFVAGRVGDFVRGWFCNVVGRCLRGTLDIGCMTALLCEFARLSFEASKPLFEGLEKRYGFVRDTVCFMELLMTVVPYTMEGVFVGHRGVGSGVRSSLGCSPSRLVCRLRHGVG